MGCGQSDFSDRFKDASEGKLERFTDRLEIHKKDVKKFFKIYCTIDNDFSGTIGVDEFFDHFDLEYSSFAERAFSIMDTDRSGDSHLQLDFSEFFVGLYNYCTLTHDTLVKFAFDMFDATGDGNIGKPEVEALVKMIYGKKAVETEAAKIMKMMDDDGSGEIGLAEFRKMEAKTRSLLFPAFQLQQQLAKKLMGGAFWKKATKQRTKVMKDTDLIEWFHAQHTGQKLNRAEVNAAAAHIVEGIVINAEGTPCKDAPGEGKILRLLPHDDKVTAYEEKVVGEGDEEKTWILISNTKAVWVLKDDCKLFETKASLEAKEKKQTEEAAGVDKESTADENQGSAEERVQAAISKKHWVRTTDPTTGRDYWYDTNSMVTTWIRPPGAPM